MVALFPSSNAYDRLTFHALARGVAAVIPNSMQKAAMNDTIVRNELKSVVRYIFGDEWTVERQRIDALGFARMATDLPIELLRAKRDEFEAECMDRGLDHTSQYRILESSIIFGYWCGMNDCPHRELDQFFAYTRTDAFINRRMSLRYSRNFLGLLGAFSQS